MSHHSNTQVSEKRAASTQRALLRPNSARARPDPTRPSSENTTEDRIAARWQRKPEERPAEILEAAFLVFGARGYSRATLSDVATEAGVCQATVSHYFGSKRHLFEAVVRDRAMRFLEAEEAVLERSTLAAGELLENVLRRLWERLLTPGTSDFVRVIHVESASFPESGRILCNQINERWRRLIAAILERGVRRADFRALNVEVTARMLLYVVVGVAQRITAYERYDSAMPDVEAMWDGLSEMVRGHVRASTVEA